MIEGQLKTIQGELRQLVNLVKAGSASAEVADEIQHLEEVKKDLAGRILKIEALTSHSLKAVYDVDVIQGTFQRFAMFINRLPVDLQIKAIRLLVELITIFKDHVIVNVFESPVEDIQKALDEKFVFGGCCLPEQGGPETNFLKRPLIGKTYCLPPINLVLDLFRVTGYEGKKFLSVVPDPA